MRKKLKFFLIAGAVFLSLFLARALLAEDKAPKPEFVFKFGTTAPADTEWGRSIERVNRLIAEKTGGRVKQIWYFGAVMGDEPDMIRKARLGQLQGLAMLTVGLQMICPETGALTLPFMFKDFAEVDCIYPKIWNMLSEAFARHGFTLLGYSDVCFAIMQSKLSPEMEAELDQEILVGGQIVDQAKNEKFLSHLKQWAWQGLGTDLLVYKLIGINNVIPLQVVDVLTAFQTGMVNSVYGSCSTTVALQWQTHVNRIIKFGGYEGVAYVPAMMVIDRKVFSSLPPDLQKIVLDVYQTELGPGSLRLSQYVRDEEKKMCAGLIKRGAQEILIAPGLTQAFAEKSQTIYREMEGKYFPPEFLAALEKARDECRAGLEAKPKP